jgi:DNA-binding GntR family transcriptional regulator
MAEPISKRDRPVSKRTTTDAKPAPGKGRKTRTPPPGSSVPVTKQERVYQAIRERILSGAYGPGYRVVIDALAEEFEISALPVREAIRRLEAEGLVIYRPNAGAQVAPADPSAFDDEMTVLALLEGYATALAAPKLGKAGLKKLREINAQMVVAAEQLDSLEFGRLNQEFHAFIYGHCSNPVLVTMLRDSARRLDAIRRTVFVQIPYRGAQSVSEHLELIELIEKGAPAARIEAKAREHKMHTVTSFQAWRAKHDRTH